MHKTTSEALADLEAAIIRTGEQGRSAYATELLELIRILRNADQTLIQFDDDKK